MSERKNIDRLFQEKFKDFEATPNPDLWNGISDHLHPKKKKRRIVPIRWWGAGSAAALLILFFALRGSNSVNHTPIETTPIVDVETPQIKEQNNESKTQANPSLDIKMADKDDSNNLEYSEEEAVEDGVSKSILKGNGAKSAIAKASNLNLVDETNHKSMPKKNGVTSNENPTTNSASETEDITLKSKLEDIIKSSESVSDTKVAETNIKNVDVTEDDLNTESLEEKTSIEDAIAEANELNEKEKEKPNRWSIAPNVAPVYFNSLSGGSAIDGQFNDNNTQGDVTMSYGIAGAYNINPRLKIKTGVNRVEFNHTTNNVLSSVSSDFIARTEVAGIENISLINSSSDVALLSTASIARSSTPEALNTTPTGNIDQRFGFIEIPVALEYRLIDKKIGVNLSGGFSTFFLNGNEIYADINGNSTLIGTANNLNDTSFSANFGIGLDYGLSRKININLEPMFKYQINTFNNTSGDFRPFFIGVYSGLSFKF